MVNIKLEKSKRNELKKISEIYMCEFSKPPYNEKWTLKKGNEKIRFYSKFYDLYSIKFNKNLIGFIVVNPNFMCPGEIAFVEEFAIKEEFQGRGIGTNILKKIINYYKSKGFESIMLIASKKSKSVKLYKKLGIVNSKEGILLEKEFK